MDREALENFAFHEGMLIKTLKRDVAEGRGPVLVGEYCCDPETKVTTFTPFAKDDAS
jgi:hypothetical protein